MKCFCLDADRKEDMGINFEDTFDSVGENCSVSLIFSSTHSLTLHPFPNVLDKYYKLRKSSHHTSTQHTPTNKQQLAEESTCTFCALEKNIGIIVPCAVLAVIIIILLSCRKKARAKCCPTRPASDIGVPPVTLEIMGADNTTRNENTIHDDTTRNENTIHADTTRNENTIHADTTRNENTIHADTTGNENTIHADTTRNENTIHADTTRQENTIHADTTRNENTIHADTTRHENTIHADTTRNENTIHADTTRNENTIHADTTRHENTIHADTTRNENTIHADTTNSVYLHDEQVIWNMITL
ncbi:hypothetical protein Btru_043287 [Bulinus truncatus]|nr:hypothetical protein Btru_043287 [Bulinus truncatus]